MKTLESLLLLLLTIPCVKSEGEPVRLFERQVKRQNKSDINGPVYLLSGKPAEVAHFIPRPQYETRQAFLSRIAQQKHIMERTGYHYFRRILGKDDVESVKGIYVRQAKYNNHLSDYIRHFMKKLHLIPSETTIMRIISQVFTAASLIHKEGFAHFDLSPTAIQLTQAKVTLTLSENSRLTNGDLTSLKNLHFRSHHSPFMFTTAFPNIHLLDSVNLLGDDNFPYAFNPNLNPADVDYGSIAHLLSFLCHGFDTSLSHQLGKPRHDLPTSTFCSSAPTELSSLYNKLISRISSPTEFAPLFPDIREVMLRSHLLWLRLEIRDLIVAARRLYSIKVLRNTEESTHYLYQIAAHMHNTCNTLDVIHQIRASLREIIHLHLEDFTEPIPSLNCSQLYAALAEHKASYGSRLSIAMKLQPSPESIGDRSSNTRFDEEIMSDVTLHFASEIAAVKNASAMRSFSLFLSHYGEMKERGGDLLTEQTEEPVSAGSRLVQINSLALLLPQSLQGDGTSGTPSRPKNSKHRKDAREDSGFDNISSISEVEGSQSSQDAQQVIQSEVAPKNKAIFPDFSPSLTEMEVKKGSGKYIQHASENSPFNNIVVPPPTRTSHNPFTKFSSGSQTGKNAGSLQKLPTLIDQFSSVRNTRLPQGLASGGSSYALNQIFNRESKSQYTHSEGQVNSLSEFFNNRQKKLMHLIKTPSIANQSPMDNSPYLSSAAFSTSNTLPSVPEFNSPQKGAHYGNSRLLPYLSKGPYPLGQGTPSRKPPPLAHSKTLVVPSPHYDREEKLGFGDNREFPETPIRNINIPSSFKRNGLPFSKTTIPSKITRTEEDSPSHYKKVRESPTEKYNLIVGDLSSILPSLTDLPESSLDTADAVLKTRKKLLRILKAFFYLNLFTSPPDLTQLNQTPHKILMQSHYILDSTCFKDHCQGEKNLKTCKLRIKRAREALHVVSITLNYSLEDKCAGDVEKSILNFCSQWHIAGRASMVTRKKQNVKADLWNEILYLLENTKDETSLFSYEFDRKSFEGKKDLTTMNSVELLQRFTIDLENQVKAIWATKRFSMNKVDSYTKEYQKRRWVPTTKNRGDPYPWDSIQVQLDTEGPSPVGRESAKSTAEALFVTRTFKKSNPYGIVDTHDGLAIEDWSSKKLNSLLVNVPKIDSMLVSTLNLLFDALPIAAANNTLQKL